MLIAICDDDINIGKNIKLICEDVLKKTYKFIDCEIVLFSDGKELVRYKDKLDIIILDIEMPKMDGISVKNRFQSLDNRTLIIFVTGHSEMMKTAMGVNVHGFVDKNNMTVELPVIFEQAIDIIKSETIIDGKIKSSKVKYIKAEHVYSILVMENGEEYSVRIPMKTLENELLQSGFIRTHREYIVNMHWIDKIDKKGIHIGDDIISISTNSKKKVKKVYDEYCMKNAKYC